MTHIVITRMSYEEDDPKFLKRFGIYKTITLPRLLSQTDQNFDIGVKCNPCHAEYFKELNKRIIPFSVSKEGLNIIKQKYSKRKLYLDFIDWKYVVGLEKYDIQTSLDSDDMVSEDFIAKIHIEVAKHKKSYPFKSLHIHFQPMLRDLKTNRMKRMRLRYGLNKSSMFYSLYQPIKNNYIFIGHDSHLKMYKYADRSVLIPEGYCWLVIHRDNDSSDMNH